MKKVLIIFSIILIFTGGGYISLYKFDRLKNFYRYLIHDEPYVNRTFYFKRNILFFDDPQFNEVRYNRDLDDSRGHFPNFQIPAPQQLTIKTSEQGLILYESFINKYNKIISLYKMTNKKIPDKLAFEIMEILNEAFKKNQKKIRLNIGKNFLSEKDYRSEDFIYFVVNEKTGCGETAEAMVSLLRGAGFKARLLRYSHNHKPVMANHMVPEFYSMENKRWIMLEPMLNTSPIIKNKHISAMEMLTTPVALKNINQMWKIAGSHKEFYNEEGLMWFNKKGLFTNFYYFSGSEKKLQNLTISVIHGP